MTISLRYFKIERVEYRSDPTDPAPAGYTLRGRFYATDEDTTSTRRRAYFLDPAQGGINTELSGDIACAASGATINITDPSTLTTVQVNRDCLTGPSHASVAGTEVVVQATSHGSGYLTIEESADGAAWALAVGLQTRPGTGYGMRFIPDAAFWHVKFYALEFGAASKVAVWSQLRDPAR